MCELLSVLTEGRSYKFWPHPAVVAELQGSHTCPVSSSPVVKRGLANAWLFLGELQLGPVQLMSLLRLHTLLVARMQVMS